MALWVVTAAADASLGGGVLSVTNADARDVRVVVAGFPGWAALC